MDKDYYKILGVNKKASKEEIKKAFRKIAHICHPDKPGGDEERFKTASEAYSVLGNDKKRAEYDAYGRVFSGQEGAGGGQGFGGFGFKNTTGAGSYEFDFGDIFNEFGDIFGGFSGTRNSVQRGRDISIDVEISFKESVFGVTRNILLTKASTCETCRGSGGKPDVKQKTCVACNGRGKIHETKNSILGTFTSVRACGICHGVGEIPEVKCPDCRGEGVLRKEQEIRLAIPAGVNDGEMIRLSGQGEALSRGSSGDLYIKLHVHADTVFTKEGSNLRMNLPLKLSDALLGSEQKITTLDGVITVKTPAGIAHGELLRVRGKGVPMGRNKRGDLLILVSITLPRKLSRKVRRLVEELREEGI